jgi:hypothetical protein
MKKITLLTALLVMSTSTAMAHQWKQLGSDGKTSYYFYNPKTYSLKDNIAGSWIKKEFNVDTAAMVKDKIEPDKYAGNKSIVAFEEYDCAKKMKRTLVGKEFDKGDENDLVRTNWLEIAPGSLDESLLNALCKEVKK